MVLAVGAQGGFAGLAQMAAWNSLTSVGSRVDVPAGGGGLKQDKPLVKAPIIRGLVPMIGAYGRRGVSGDIGGPWYPEGYGKIFAAGGLIRSTSSGTGFKTHTFAMPTSGSFDNEYGLAVYENRDFQVWRSLNCFAKTLSWTIGEEPWVSFKASMVGAVRERDTAITPSFGTLLPMSPMGDGSTTGLIISATINGQSYTDILANTGTITVNTGVDLAKAANRPYPVKPMRTGQVGIVGSFGFYYSSNTGSPSADWLAAWDGEVVVTNMTIKILGPAISGSSPTTHYELRFVLPTVYITEGDPIPDGPGTIGQTYNFEAVLSAMSSTPPTIVLVSAETLP